MKKKFNVKKFAIHVGKIAIIMAIIFLVIYLATLLSSSTTFYEESVDRNARVHFNKDMKAVSDLVEKHYDELYKVADQLKFAETPERVDEILSACIGNEAFGELRYYSQNVSYYFSGDVVAEDSCGYDEIQKLAIRNEAGCTPVFYDDYYGLDCVAFFVPVRGSSYVDGLVSVLPAQNIISVEEIVHENASVVAVVGFGGKVLASATDGSIKFPAGGNVYDFLDEFTQNKSMVDSVGNILIGKDVGVTEIQSNGVSYTVVAEPIDPFDDNMYLITFCMSDQLISAELGYIRHVVYILIFTIVAFIVGLVLAFLFWMRSKTDGVNLNHHADTVVDCANTDGFQREAVNLINLNGQNCAVVTIATKNFQSIADTFGEEASNEFLQFMQKVLATFCNKKETYGYLENDRFVMLTEFTTENAFRNRIKIFEGVINKHSLFKENQFKIRLAAGACLCFVGKRRSMADMIDCSITACENAQMDPNVTCCIYSEKIREQVKRNDMIEERMEGALVNGDLRLFLQPKYNAQKDQIDSAEALVRWFDGERGDYIYPAEFISFFESNGFIVKMDHFIYLEVLKYVSEAKERGDRIVPISVNVSSVTAASPDFVNFYVGNKNKYLIDDGFITLEFSETFGTENYKKMAGVIAQLRSGGIRCSIDFGVGYSSFRVLKELAMDDLKLNRLFLASGLDGERDDKILTSIISLARDLGMTVIQEGVETEEMFEKCREMGIGIIQGYYYAKVIPLEEFKIFIKSNTSIRYKSVVK